MISEDKQSLGWRLSPMLIIAAAAVIALVVIKLAPSPATREAPEIVPVVEVVDVVQETLTLQVETQGTVRPATETTLVAQVAGEINRIGENLSAGSLAEAGEVLAFIDPRDYQLAVTQSEVTLSQARLQLETELARARIAREEWTALGDGEPPPLAARGPQTASAQAAVAAAEAGLEQARLSLSRTRLRTPYRARVRAKLADRGQYVTPGVPIAELVGTEQAEIPLPIAQDQLRFLDANMVRTRTLAIPVKIRLGPEWTWNAKIVRSSGELDPRTRMLTLTAVVDDPLALEADHPPLPFGAFVSASIDGQLVEGVVVLPRAALRPRGRVLVFTDDERLRFRDVDILRTEGDRVLINGGLSAGERVCVSPLEAPVEGMRAQAATSIGTQSSGASPE